MAKIAPKAVSNLKTNMTKPSTKKGKDDSLVITKKEFTLHKFKLFTRLDDINQKLSKMTGKTIAKEKPGEEGKKEGTAGESIFAAGAAFAAGFLIGYAQEKLTKMFSGIIDSVKDLFGSKEAEEKIIPSEETPAEGEEPMKAGGEMGDAGASGNFSEDIDSVIEESKPLDNASDLIKEGFEKETTVEKLSEDLSKPLEDSKAGLEKSMEESQKEAKDVLEEDTEKEKPKEPPANAVTESSGKPVETGTGGTVTAPGAAPALPPTAAVPVQTAAIPQGPVPEETIDKTKPIEAPPIAVKKGEGEPVKAASNAPTPPPPAPVGTPQKQMPKPTPSVSGDDKSTMAMVKQHEGFKNTPYKDSKGLWTVGVGHLIGDGKSLPKDWDRTFTNKEVDELFVKDFDHHKKMAESGPGYDKANNTGKAALIDLTFNLGGAWTKKFKKAGAALDAGDFKTAADEMVDSQWYKQVKGRAVTITNMLRNGSDADIKSGGGTEDTQVASASPASTPTAAPTGGAAAGSQMAESSVAASTAENKPQVASVDVSKRNAKDVSPKEKNQPSQVALNARNQNTRASDQRAERATA